MAPVSIDCLWVWQEDSFDCYVNNIRLDGPIKTILIEASPHRMALWGNSDIHVEGMYCFLDGSYNLECSKSLLEIAHMEEDELNKVIRRFGYTERDLRPYVAYGGL